MGFDNEFDKLVRIREELHASAECSQKEYKTAGILMKYLEESSADRIFTNIGGNGIVAEFYGSSDGSVKMFRSEMDAVKTGNRFEHLCGHDGHMTILLGLAMRLSSFKNFPGKVYLLFQPAEEIGRGAKLMLKDLHRLGLKFDCSFALHNKPGYHRNSIVIHKGTYAAASTGMEMTFTGVPSHAAFPEKAVSPLKAIISTINYICSLNSSKDIFSDYVHATIVNISLGEKNFGITPGKGCLRITLRSFKEEDLAILVDKVRDHAKYAAEQDGLKLKICFKDAFPATVNSDYANEKLIKAANKLERQVIYTDIPSRGSDDFAFFAMESKAAYFDVGNGVGGADIHMPGYMFSDEILIPSVDILYNLIKY